MKSKAIIFNLKNYDKNAYIKRNNLNLTQLNFNNRLYHFDVVKIYSYDVTCEKVTKTSITNSIYKLALDSHRFKLENVYVHFKCCGCVNKHNNDFSFYPIDYKESGEIEINKIKEIVKQFYFGTKALFVFDYYDNILKQFFTYNLVF